MTYFDATFFITDGPGSVTFTANDTVTEGLHDLILTCNVPGGDAGNPDVYSYYWMYPYSTAWINTTFNVITIDRSTVNATLHDGTWQCKAGNIAGNTATSRSVLVYGLFKINIFSGYCPSCIEKCIISK